MNPNPIATVRAVREAANEPAPRTHAGSLQGTPAPLLVHDLYHDFEGLGPLLFSELSRGAWFNAFLLAAGMNQTVEDYLHPDPYRLNKGAGYLSDLRRPLGPLAASAARASAMAIVRMRRLRPSHRRLAAWQAELAALVGQLAEVVIDANPPAGASAALAASAEALLAAPAGNVPSGLRRDVLHLPSCFRSFMDAVLDGIFTVPGDGGVDYPTILKRLCDAGYEGWLVVEAEQDPRKAHPLTYARMGYENLLRMARGAGFTVETRETAA